MRIYRWVILKYTLYALLAVLLFHLQSARLLPAFWGIRPLPVAALFVAVSMQEREIPAGLFAVLCGYLTDLFSYETMGYYMLFFFVWSVVIGLLSRTYLHPSAPMAALLTWGSLFFCRLLVLLFRIAIPGGSGFWRELLLRELPMAVYTAALAVPLFLLVRFIAQKMTERQNARL